MEEREHERQLAARYGINIEQCNVIVTKPISAISAILFHIIAYFLKVCG